MPSSTLEHLVPVGSPVDHSPVDHSPVGTIRGVDLRRATLGDAPALMEIYNREVLETTTTFDLVPRTLAEQEEFIAVRSGGLSVLVAETGPDSGCITGFASLSFYRDRSGYRTSVEDSVYVHRDHVGQGIGTLLLSGVIEEARGNGFHAMFARIIGSQEPSMLLHQRLGFEVVGVEREVGRKFGRWRDVALLQLLL